MKIETAVQHLKTYMIALQKYRSNVAETRIFENNALAATMWPWVFGDNCPIPALQKILDGYDKTGVIAPSDYYNMMFILWQFTPEVVPIASMIGSELPTDPPSTSILMGWDRD